MVISKDNPESPKAKRPPTWEEISSVALRGGKQMLETLESRDRIVQATLNRHGYPENTYDISEFRFQKHHLPMLEVTITFHEGQWDETKISNIQKSFSDLNLKPEIDNGVIKVTLKLKK